MSKDLRFGLTQDTIQKILQVFACHPNIEKVYVYGSRAKETYRPNSDIDLTLIAPKMTIAELFKIETELDDLLLPYKFDLSLFHTLDNQQLVEHIERVKKEFV